LALAVFTVRPYTQNDLKQLIGVYQSAFAEPPWNETWTSEQITEDLELALSQRDPLVLVAEERNQLVGFTWGYRLPLDKFPFLEGKIMPNCSYMDEIAVRADMRKKGIGKTMGRTYLEKATSQNMDEVVLRTDERNKASMALFEKLRFEGFKQPRLYDPQYPNRIYLAKFFEQFDIDCRL